MAAKATSILSGFPGGSTRRGAVIQAVGGLTTFLAGCVVLPALLNGPGDWGAVVLAGVLYGGLAALLTGMASLGVLAAAPYLEERIDRLSREDF